MTQGTINNTLNVGTSSVEALSLYNRKRTVFALTNTGATVLTIAKGDVAAVAGSGIILQPSASMIESTDSGFTCWQGAIQVIGNGAGGTLAISETFEY